eukprot:TRINITY_DN1863_c0_g1_i2.p2 TRINITY_DN1863_c0_g1~~TRINITY_DN1863_c0_g1_i2.p2  ORF type:complete len:118 (-),score=31.51 TRINITY_DN1863_c0_g1_i2:36-389(-)
MIISEGSSRFKFVVVDSIRHPEEVRVLREHASFASLVAVDAPTLKRFSRCTSRSRESDPTTLEEFVSKDDRELFGLAGRSSQRIRECMSDADAWILNDTDVLVELHQKIRIALKNIF